MNNLTETRALGSILEEKAGKLSDKIFFYFEDKQYTYQDTNRYACQIANGYLSLGVKKGDMVTVMLPNCPEFVLNWFGLAKLGAVDSPINIAYKGDLLKHVIVNSNPRVLVIHEDFAERILPIQHELDGLEHVVIHGSSNKIKGKIQFPVITFEELMDHSPDFSTPEEIYPSDHCIIIYTSGTSGPSKGVVLSHNALYCYTADAIKMLGFNENDVMFSCLPLYHANIRVFTIMNALLNETSFAMSDRYSASKFWDEIRRYNATTFCFLGGMGIFMLNQPPKDDDGDNPARTAWGGPIPLDIAEAFEKRFDVKLYCGFYGLTEASGVTWISAREADNLKAKGKWAQAMGMGREQKHIYEVKLVDDDDNEVTDGETGEIICRPARPYSMMTEYINNAKATAEVSRNFWFHTGDLGRKDEDGYYHFMDRKKDYMRRRGENISSFEVEKVINAHVAVYDSAAIGVKSEVGEDEIMIVIKLKEGEALIYEDLMAWCEERMAYFMVPRYVRIIKDDFPRTPTGRIEKYKLRNKGITDDTWDREKAGYIVNR